MPSRSGTAEEAKEFLKLLNYDPNEGKFYYAVRISNAIQAGTRAGYLTEQGYHRLCRKDRSFPEHKMVWLAETGDYPEDEQVDHKNRVRNDNRFSNLRLCSNFENCLNRPVRGKSKYRGVYFDPWMKKWRAETSVDGKKRALGRFDTEEEAYAAWVQATAHKYKADFAYEVSNG